MKTKYSEQAQENEKLKKSIHESKTKDSNSTIDISENFAKSTELEALKLEYENYKSTQKGRLDPKITQTILNLVNENSLNLYFHLYIPSTLRYDEVTTSEKTGHQTFMMFKTCSKTISQCKINFKLELGWINIGKKAHKYMFFLRTKTEKTISCMMAVKLTKISKGETLMNLPM